VICYSLLPETIFLLTSLFLFEMLPTATSHLSKKSHRNIIRYGQATLTLHKRTMPPGFILPVPGLFTHSPLNAGEVRLLQFLHGDYLRCELIHANLDRAPDYAALSYTWGDGTNVPHRLTNLSLNGLTLQIGENLCRALAIIGKEIRERAIYLWVDAVCINQNDLLERNSHLFLMPTIYSKAVVVTIWLGEESEDAPQAMEEIVNLVNHLDVLARANAVGLRTDDTSHISPHDPICLAAAGSQTIWNILNKPWFSRVWIAQEVTWTQERKFFCGRSYFKWEHVSWFTGVLYFDP
jgi:hypothetical protein